MELKHYIGAKIKELRLLNNMTQNDLAHKMHTTKQTISRYENGQRKADQDVLFELCDIFNVSIDDFFPSADKNVSLPLPSTLTLITEASSQLNENRQLVVLNTANEQLEEQEKENRKVVNLSEIRELYEDYQTQQEDVDVHGGVSAGTGVDLYDEVIETIKYPKPIPAHDIALRVIGDSMTPLFQDGELIFVKKTQEIHNGQIGVFIVNGQGFVKKIMKGIDTVKLISLNKKYKDIVLNEHDDVRTVGLVVF